VRPTSNVELLRALRRCEKSLSATLSLLSDAGLPYGCTFRALPQLGTAREKLGALSSRRGDMLAIVPVSCDGHSTPSLPPGQNATCSVAAKTLTCDTPVDRAAATNKPSTPTIMTSNDPSGTALAHPQLRGIARRIQAAGFTLAVDTSLNYEKKPGDERLPLQATHAVLGIGGYFDVPRKCVGLAVDSPFHELVHEMTHLSFHCLVRAPLATPSGPARVFSTAGTLEPLRTHFDALRRRGLSELAAEEVICREHELYVIRSAQMPIWRSWVAQLPVIDEALQQVRQGVLTVAPADRSRQQMTLLYLTSASRFLITSREAQRFHVFLAIVVRGCCTSTFVGSGLEPRTSESAFSSLHISH